MGDCPHLLAANTLAFSTNSKTVITPLPHFEKFTLRPITLNIGCELLTFPPYRLPWSLHFQGTWPPVQLSTMEFCLYQLPAAKPGDKKPALIRVNLLSVFCWCRKFSRWCSETSGLMRMPFRTDVALSCLSLLAPRLSLVRADSLCCVLSAHTWTDTVSPIIQVGLLYFCSTREAVCCCRLRFHSMNVLSMENQNEQTTLNTIRACYVLHNKHKISQTTSIYQQTGTYRTGVKLRPHTGRFIMFSLITNIYNKKTKGPTLMEFFTATGKLNFLSNRRQTASTYRAFHNVLLDHEHL